MENPLIRKRTVKAVNPLYPPIDGKEAVKGLVRKRFCPTVMPYISIKDLNKPFPGEDPGGPSHLAIEIGIKGTF